MKADPGVAASVAEKKGLSFQLRVQADGGRTLIPKFPDHPIESIGFGRIAVIRGGELANRGLQSRNTDLLVR